MKYINDEHRDYGINEFSEKSLEKNPFLLFSEWFNLAKNKVKFDHNAFVLSTSSLENQPSSRILLLKYFDEQGFVFFSNFESKKGKDLESNPKASILFFWPELEKQIRILGTVEKISQEDSYDYFKTRPYTSRIGAWASKQSSPLSSRFKLLREVALKMLQYPLDVPLPPYWGGYRLCPFEFEFWQGRPSRLHDRFQYTKNNGIWTVNRLYP